MANPWLFAPAHLPSFESKIPRHRITGLDTRKLVLLEFTTSSVKENAPIWRDRIYVEVTTCERNIDLNPFSQHNVNKKSNTRAKD